MVVNQGSGPHGTRYVSQSTFSGCSVTASNKEVCNRRQVVQESSGCPDEATSALTVSGVQPVPGECGTQQLVITGTGFTDSMLVHVDGRSEAQPSILSSTEAVLELPPAPSAMAMQLTTTEEGQKLQDQSPVVLRNITFEYAIDDEADQAQQSVEYLHLQTLALLPPSCGLWARFLFSENLDDDASERSGTTPATAEYARGRTGLPQSALDLDGNSLTVPELDSTSGYTVAAWLKLDETQQDAAPGGWSISSGQCTATYPAVAPQPSSVWKFVALRGDSAGNRTLTIGLHVADPEGSLGQLLQAAQAGASMSLADTGVVIDELWQWTRILTDLELVAMLNLPTPWLEVGGEAEAGESSFDMQLSTGRRNLATGYLLEAYLPTPGQQYSRPIYELGTSEPVEATIMSAPILDLTFAVGEGPYSSQGAEARFYVMFDVEPGAVYDVQVEADDGIAIQGLDNDISELGTTSTGDAARTVLGTVTGAAGASYIQLVITHRNNAADGTTIKLQTKLSGESSYSSPTLHLDGQWSISMWLRPLNLTPGPMQVVAQGGEHWVVSLHNTVVRVDIAGDESTQSFILTDATLASHVWSHLAVSYSGDALAVYIDGRLAARKPVATERFVIRSAATVRIGGQSALLPNSTPLRCHVRSVRLFSKALSSNEAAALTCDGSSSSATDALFVFAEGRTRDVSNAGTYSATTTAGPSIWDDAFASGPDVADSACTQPAAVEIQGVDRLTDITAGEMRSVMLQAHTACGALVTRSGLSLELSLSSPLVTWVATTQPLASTAGADKLAVFDLGDGTYSVMMNMTLSGTYNATLTVEGSLVAVKTIVVHPGIADPQTSQLEPLASAGGKSPFTEAQVGVLQRVRLQLRDQYGNQKDWSAMEAGEFELAVSVASGARQVATSITDTQQGTVNIEYTLRSPGVLPLAWHLRI